MILRRLTFSPFMNYASFDREFPDRGVILIVGPNGTGKSTIVDGICWATHGQTTRGTVFRRPQKVTEIFDAGGETWTVVRERDIHGKVTLALRQGWIGISDSNEDGGITVTETQKKIDALVGDWRRFSSTRVFSKELMTRFGLATDKERKSLLEGLLGLGKFDQALESARERYRKLNVSLNDQRLVLAGMEGELRAQYSGPPVEELQVELQAAETERDRFNELWISSRKTAFTLGSQVGVLRDGIAATQRELDVAQARSLAPRKGLECPVCLRMVSPDDLHNVQQHYSSQIQACTDLLAKDKIQLDFLSGLLEEAQESQTTMALSHSTAIQLVRDLKSNIEAANRQLAKLAEVEAKRAEVARGEMELAVLQASQDVFGLQGARNLLLGQALARLEGATNSVLQRLGVTYRVALRGTTVQKNKREVDKVSIETEGVGDGDYHGASGGEKVCLDVSMLMGLSVMDKRGQSGIIFQDEVFDSLDKTRVEAVAGLLTELGQSRQVVVITHSEDLASKFPQSAVWRLTPSTSNPLVEAAE